ncbi:hypothetical protein THOM_0172 [Trachipleistophora hominis]|uniref:Uncharacterized protein n=1 Tax=Trachipleistophora hominis TaxID=72359 RepID=L7JZG1_TRAHO|nr:hypothetical protein THOM_0172 [Trachipleistophora hominis]
MAELYTINQWKNELRHYGIRIGNGWYFSLEEILYLKKKDVIAYHPLFASRIYKNACNSKNFQKKFAIYCHFKENEYNIIDNRLYHHTKNFNRKYESCIAVLQFVRKDENFELTDCVFTIISETDFYTLKVEQCVLDLKLSKKHIKDSCKLVPCESMVMLPK